MEKLEKAYKFLLKLKDMGDVENIRISQQDMHYIESLIEDLLPNTPTVIKSNLKENLVKIFVEDTKWNKELGYVLDEFYECLARDSTLEGLRLLEAFIEACPSKWYGSIAKIEIDNFKNPQ